LVFFLYSLSRILKHDWVEDVFPFREGIVEAIDPEKIVANKKLVLPKLPRTRSLGYLEELKVRNQKILSSQPWTLGLVEAMGTVDLVSRQKYETKNRAALILLDSNFEIALKEFIVHSPKLFPPFKYDDAKITQLFARRTNVINEVKPHFPKLNQTLLGKISHYYMLRNKLIHERATATVTDREIEDYRDVIEKVLNMLFKLKF
jgi:hypothetical protein